MCFGLVKNHKIFINFINKKINIMDFFRILLQLSPFLIKKFIYMTAVAKKKCLF